MNRGVLALLTRSLTIRGRSVSTYVSRFFLVLFLFIVMFSVKSDAEESLYAAPGLELFRSLTLINVGFIALYTMAFFTSTITEEKEEGTLGLLRMTKLSPVAIILGKSGARAFDVMLLLATQLPFTLLSITLGGISFEQIIAMYISLGALLFFSFNVAVCFSIICARTRNASGMTFLFFLMFFVSPFLIEAVIKIFEFHHNPSFVLGMVESLIDHAKKWSIPVSVQDILSTDFNGKMLNEQVISNVFFALCFFLLGMRCFSFFNSGQPVKAAQRSILLTRRSWMTNQRRRVWNNPILWKEFFFVAGGPPIFVAKIIGYTILVLMIFGALIYQKLKIVNGGIPLLIIFSIIGVIEIGLLAGRLFREEIKWQTWPTLTLLPYSVNKLFYQKIVGATLSLTPVFLFIIFSGLLNFAETKSLFKGREEPWAIFLMFSQVILFAHGTLVLSLYLRQGAFAMSLGFVIAFNGITLFVLEKFRRELGDLRFDSAAKIIVFLNIVLSIVIHLRSRKRLEDLASAG